MSETMRDLIEAMQDEPIPPHFNGIPFQVIAMMPDNEMRFVSGDSEVGRITNIQCPPPLGAIHRTYNFHGIQLVTTHGGYPTVDDNGVVTIPADGIIMVPDGQRYIRMQAGEQLPPGDAIVERDGLAYRANGVWRPATPENCPHFWVPRTYSLPPEVQTVSVDVKDPPVPPPSVARMAEIMESAYIMGVDWAEQGTASAQCAAQRVNLLQAAAMTAHDLSMQVLDESYRHDARLEISALLSDRLLRQAEFGEIGSDADRETVDADDLDVLFAKIDEVLEEGED